MANPAAIRTALETRLKSIQGVHVYKRAPNGFNLPCLVIDRQTAEPEQTFGNGQFALWKFNVVALVSLAGGYETAQDSLDKLTGVSSTGTVFGAISADSTLGGVVSFVNVVAWGDDQQMDLTPDLSALGVVFDLEVWA